jgi:hypothetical protein
MDMTLEGQKTLRSTEHHDYCEMVVAGSLRVSMEVAGIQKGMAGNPMEMPSA